MTSYVPPQEIFDTVLEKLLRSGKSEEQVMAEIRAVLSSARDERREAKRDDFSPTIPGYIPAYGAYTSAKAMIVYCRLRRLMRSHRSFKRWLIELLAPLRSEDDVILLVRPPYVLPYIDTPGEPYMSTQQAQHFRAILHAWRRELAAQAHRKEERLFLWHAMGDQHIAASKDFSSNRLDQRRNGEREWQVIARIDAALQRIDEGSYGYCTKTQKPIGLRRLEDRPLATECPDASMP